MVNVPWVLFYLLQGRTVSGIITQHSLQKILALWRQVSSSQSFPVSVVDAVAVTGPEVQLVVEEVVVVGFGEGEVANDDNEEDHAHGEYVGLSAIVGEAVADLGSHVALSASVVFQLVDVLVGGEAEVSQLQAHVLVRQDVLELDVAVDNAARVQVLQLLDHLLQEVKSDLLAHCFASLADVEENGAFDVFHDNVDDALLLALSVRDHAIGAVLE